MPLLEELIVWEYFRESLEKVHYRDRASTVGRRPIDVVLMFKSLVLLHLYSLFEEELGFQIRV